MRLDPEQGEPALHRALADALGARQGPRAPVAVTVGSPDVSIVAPSRITELVDVPDALAVGDLLRRGAAAMEAVTLPGLIRTRLYGRRHPAGGVTEINGDTSRSVRYAVQAPGGETRLTHGLDRNTVCVAPGGYSKVRTPHEPRAAGRTGSPLRRRRTSG